MAVGSLSRVRTRANAREGGRFKVGRPRCELRLSRPFNLFAIPLRTRTPANHLTPRNFLLLLLLLPLQRFQFFPLESLDFFGRSSSERERERGDDQFPPGRISGFSGVEREDEVYSARQLSARDTEKAVKPEQPADPILVEPLLTTKLRLRVQVNNNNNNNNNNNKSNKSNLEEATLDGNEERFSLQPEVDSLDRAKPLTVTSSTFRAADNKPRRAQDGSRKDNTFPRPVQSTSEKSFAGVQALKQSLEESIKENNEPRKKQQCRRAPFEFQVNKYIVYIYIYK